MNILYLAAHAVLEDDEVRLFQRLGHNVVCLGGNGKHGSIFDTRPPITFSASEIGLYDQFDSLGGKFAFGAGKGSVVIPEKFMQLIDVVIVPHEAETIVDFWSVLCKKPVVWRTIGQGIEPFERILRPYRDAGLKIVRYSPVEFEVPQTLGWDALIRFGKSSKIYSGWTGETKRVLTFSNAYQQRYPDDFSDYLRIVDGMPSILSGVGNATPNAIGHVSWVSQIELLKTSRVYLYASGLEVPYTLNFIEAWICGIPIVVYAPPSRQGKYFEIDRLVEDNVNGYVCRSVEEARQRISELFDDPQLSTRIGGAGREAAIRLFGEDNIEKNWEAFLLNICPPVLSPSTNITSSSLTSSSDLRSISKRVFDAISLLRPFDIDVDKIHIGSKGDGGYILTDNISPHNDLISFGVGPDVTFEMQMAVRGHRVFLHDHTVDGPPEQHDRFVFRKIGVSGHHEADLITLDNCLELAGQLSDRLLLKMDIEGEEWEVFSTVSDETLERFDQIVVEIHWLENLGSADYESKFSRSLQKINQQFTLFHVHANNCVGISIVHGYTVASVLELSFVRTSLVKRGPSRTVYPSLLNRANDVSRPDHALLFYPFLPAGVAPDRIEEMATRIDLQHKFPW